MEFRKNYAYILAALLLPITTLAPAAPFWRCTAFNGPRTYHWTAVNAIRPNAVQNALALCRTHVARPVNCAINPAVNCTQVLNPVQSHCLVMDRHGRRWRSVGVNACGNALARCRAWHRRTIRGPWSCQIIVR